MKTIGFSLLCIILISCSDRPSGEPEIENCITINSDTTVSDCEGNIYNAIKIGDQIWLAENLKTTYTSAGVLLNGVFSYDNNDGHVEEYGRLYTWESAISACPMGWHLPSNGEWDVLISALGSDAAEKLIEGGTSGMNLRMGGRLGSDSFGYMGSMGAYWTSSEFDDHATQKFIITGESNVITDNTSKSGALSVRYIKD